MSDFSKKVIEIVRQIPYGKVASYGQIALYCGMPRAAREVGWTLRLVKEDMPWWRVVNNEGRISIDGNRDADKNLQSKLLRAEGIEVKGDYTFEIEKYRWIMPFDQLKKLQLSEEYIQKVMGKYEVKSKVRSQNAKTQLKIQNF